MKTVTRLLILAFLCASFGLAQSAFFYTNISSDGQNLYLSGTIQSSSWSGSYGAVHTYAQNLYLTSPKGRYNSCSFSNPQPASQPAYYQCETSLSLDDSSGNLDAGYYTVGGYQQAVCSEVGQFAYLSISTLATLVISTSGYHVTKVARPVDYSINDPCDCSCPGPSNIQRPLVNDQYYYPYWVLKEIGLTSVGLSLCFPNALTPKFPYSGDIGSTSPVTCGDYIPPQ